MIVMEGAIAVKAVLEEDRRKVHRLIMDKNKKDRNFAYIRRLAEKKHVPVQLMKREEMDKTARGKTYGGILLECEERRYDAAEDILNSDKPLFLAYTEGIEDPFNMGYIMRTFYAAGCDALITPEREWGDNEAAIEKSSAGAYEKLPVIMLEDRVIELLKKRNVSVFVAGRKDAVSLYEADFTGDVCIAVGGPKRGLSKEIENISTQTLFIPYERDFKNALNASSAASVFAYEVYRQRNANVI